MFLQNSSFAFNRLGNHFGVSLPTQKGVPSAWHRLDYRERHGEEGDRFFSFLHN